ncbi:hypothetical protein HDF16_001104 [Granulicella aggregans]|uniref:Uncharacterized protein n=1 Tax=Granulicella aggregans TaxID=474949 RepID=A0A7W8E2Q2_9BACT|nr:hypothetical protein [Granulicella aggregans]MBB5056419.1 hypothetical protein [Granulicella aggregans]
MKVLLNRRLVSTLLCIAISLGAAGPLLAAKKAGPKNTPNPNTTNKPVPSPVQSFDGDKADSSFTWDQLVAGTASIAIWNKSSSIQAVAIEGGSLIVLSSTQPASTTSTIPFEVSPATAKIDPWQAMSFVISLKDKKAKPAESGAYGGVVRIKSTDPAKDSIFRTFRIAVQAPRPALSKINFVAWRIIPFLPIWCASGHVPLAVTLGPDSPAKPRTVGYLHKDLQGWAQVQWTKVKQRKDGSSVAVLEISHLHSAGRYEGDINLLGTQDKTSQLSVSVTAKDIFLWPVLMICLGIWVAWQAKRYLGVLRITWGLRKQEADLGAAFQKSQQKFLELANGKPFASYSIAKDISDQRAAVRSDLDELEKLHTTSLTSNVTYDNVVTALQTLQQQIAQWPELASAAVSLDKAVNTALANIDPSATIPVHQYPRNPAFLSDVQKFLMGIPIAGAGIAPLTKEILDAASLVRTWDEANQSAVAVSKAYGSIVSAGGANAGQAQLDAIRDSLIAVWTHLWQGKVAGDFATGPGTDLDSALQGITRLKSDRKMIASLGPPMVASATSALDHLSELQSFPSASYSEHLPADDTQRAAMLVRAIGLWDQASVILALIIALITGLNTNYWSKPFGTFQDYAVLFLWAAGTKIGVDIVTAVTDKLVSAASLAPRA